MSKLHVYNVHASCMLMVLCLTPWVSKHTPRSPTPPAHQPCCCHDHLYPRALYVVMAAHPVPTMMCLHACMVCVLTQNVINQFTAMGGDPRVSYFGNVTLGRDVSLRELRDLYHGVGHGS